MINRHDQVLRRETALLSFLNKDPLVASHTRGPIQQRPPFTPAMARLSRRPKKWLTSYHTPCIRGRYREIRTGIRQCA